MAVEISAHRAREPVSQAQAPGHDLAAQIEIPIAQAHLLAHLLIVLERQRLGAVEEFELAREQLHASGSQMGIDRPFRPRTHAPRHTHHEFTAQPLGLAEHRLSRGIEYDLQQSFAIAQVDEDHPAMIAAPMHPAGNRDLLADEQLVDLSAVM